VHLGEVNHLLEVAQADEVIQTAKVNHLLEVVQADEVNHQLGLVRRTKIILSS